MTKSSGLFETLIPVVVFGSNPISSNHGDQHIAFRNRNFDYLNEVITQPDCVDVHENLLRIKIPAKAVVEASGRPLTFFSTIADKDLAAHFAVGRPAPSTLTTVSNAESYTEEIGAGEFQ